MFCVSHTNCKVFKFIPLPPTSVTFTSVKALDKFSPPLVAYFITGLNLSILALLMLALLLKLPALS
ncbi:hypothetical protein D3C76_1041960 [compost metagenome]